MPQSITVAAGMVSSGMVTLVANDTCTITFADNIGAVDVMNDGAADVWYTTDGTTPTVGGQNTWRLPAGALMVDTGRPTTNSPADVVKLISTGTPVVTIQRA